MAKTITIEDRTLNFIREYNRLKLNKLLPRHNELAKILGVKNVSSISEILGQRQNIQMEQWVAFKKHFNIKNSELSEFDNDTFKALEAKNKLLIEEKEARLQELKHDKDLLADLIRSNLTVLIQAQETFEELQSRLVDKTDLVLAELRGGHRWQIELEAQGDTRKEQSLIVALSKHVDVFVPDRLKKGKPS